MSIADLSENVIRNAEDYVELMKFVFDVTVTVSSEKYPTCGLVLPLQAKIMKHFTVSDNDRTFIKRLKNAIRSDISGRYNQPELRCFLEEVSCLDPRMKTKKKHFARSLGSYHFEM